MKIPAILFALSLTSCTTINVSANNYTNAKDEKILAEAVVLSKQVKEFEKSIGIEPTLILTKTSNESPPFSTIVIYLHRRGAIANKPKIDFTFIFSKQISDTPINRAYTFNKDFSVYWRRTEAIASNDEVTITPDFAKSSKLRQVEVNIHEDLHKNMVHLYDTEYTESLVTPIAYIAAMLFFEKAGDLENAQNTKYYMEYFRRISADLNGLSKEVHKIFENNEIYFGDAQEKVYNIIITSKYYSLHYIDKTKNIVKMGANIRDPLEALISHDLYYLKDFDRVVSLYEKIGDLKTLIEEIKNAPAETEAVKNYLDKLEQKYSKPVRDF